VAGADRCGDDGRELKGEALREATGVLLFDVLADFIWAFRKREGHKGVILPNVGRL
jgi:hypothetical protein